MSAMRDLEVRILSNPTVAKVFSSGFEVYLVGGYLRDILRGAVSADADFIFRGEAHELRSWLSANIDGTVIEFKKGPILRVVSDEDTLDFAHLTGGIEEDLASRDFTMNAAAWSPERGLIDPLKGARDIERELIRAVSKENLVSDPLRLLRAYRFAAELGWRIDAGTRGLIRELKTMVRIPASERITLELMRILDAEYPAKILRATHSDGILSSIISCTSFQLEANIKVLSCFRQFLEEIHDKYHLKFEGIFSQGFSLRALLNAEILLHGANLAQSRLKLSATALRRITSAQKAMSLFLEKPKATKDDLFDCFETAGHSVTDFALLTRRKRVFAEATRFLQLKTFLSAEEILLLSGLQPGPQLGALLRELRRMQFSQRVTSQSEARRWLVERCNAELT